ncbi:MAG: hypothetical protein DRH49_06205 [Candidatus Coatesbacteria bacterium]|nr:MAG: hypothetical protein DRH49_06205 [Candidatus Coatesbacteria bacterium]
MRRNLLIVLVIFLILGLTFSRYTPYKWDEIDIVRSGEITPEEYMTFMKIFEEKEEFIRNNDPNDMSSPYQTQVPKETVEKMFFAIVKDRNKEYLGIEREDLIFIELSNLHGEISAYEVIAYLGEGKTPTVEEILSSIRDDCYRRWLLHREYDNTRREIGEYRRKWEEKGNDYKDLLSDPKYLELNSRFEELEDRWVELREELGKIWEKDYVSLLIHGYYEIYALGAGTNGLSGLLPSYWITYWDLKEEFGEEPHFIAFHLSPPISWEFEVSGNDFIYCVEGRMSKQEAIDEFSSTRGDIKNKWVLVNFFDWRWVEETGEVMDHEKYKKFMSTLDINPEWF